MGVKSKLLIFIIVTLIVFSLTKAACNNPVEDVKEALTFFTCANLRIVPNPANPRIGDDVRFTWSATITPSRICRYVIEIPGIGHPNYIPEYNDYITRGSWSSKLFNTPEDKSTTINVGPIHAKTGYGTFTATVYYEDDSGEKSDKASQSITIAY